MNRSQLDTFLKELYLSGGNVSAVCRHMKISRSLVYKERATHAAFAEAWNRVLRHIKAEDKSAGNRPPSSQQSDEMLMASLQLMRPETYGWIESEPIPSDKQRLAPPEIVKV